MARRAQALSDDARRRGVHLAVYGATDDAAVFGAAELRQFNISTLASFAPLLEAEAGAIDAAAAALPGRGERRVEALRILVDQLVCARAGTLLLNVFSTFSQVRLAWISRSKW